MTKQIPAEEARELGVAAGQYRGLTLVPGPRVIQAKWHYDRVTEHGEYHFYDVTDVACAHLFDAVSIVPNVRLRDIFQLTLRHLDVLLPVIGNWCDEIINEGLTNIKPWSGIYDPEGIEYLELYRLLEIYTDAESQVQPPILDSIDLLNFHGIGFELRDSTEEGFERGGRITWGIEYTPTNELADIPLVVNPEVSLYDDRLAGKARLVATYHAPPPRLINLLHAVFWELSFAGSPTHRNARKAEMDRLVDEVKNEEANTKPWSELS